MVLSAATRVAGSAVAAAFLRFGGSRSSRCHARKTAFRKRNRGKSPLCCSARISPAIRSRCAAVWRAAVLAMRSDTHHDEVACLLTAAGTQPEDL